MGGTVHADLRTRAPDRGRATNRGGNIDSWLLGVYERPDVLAAPLRSGLTGTCKAHFLRPMIVPL